MDRAKIASFYEVPIKQACDAISAKKAFNLKAFSTSTQLGWAALRWAKFFAHWGRGRLQIAVLRPSRESKEEKQNIMQWARR